MGKRHGRVNPLPLSFLGQAGEGWESRRTTRTSPHASYTRSRRRTTCSNLPTSVGTASTFPSPYVPHSSLANVSRASTLMSATATLSPRLCHKGRNTCQRLFSEEKKKLNKERMSQPARAFPRDLCGPHLPCATPPYDAQMTPPTSKKIKCHGTIRGYMRSEARAAPQRGIR
jgi:hypothetical protein